MSASTMAEMSATKALVMNKHLGEHTFNYSDADQIARCAVELYERDVFGEGWNVSDRLAVNDQLQKLTLRNGDKLLHLQVVDDAANPNFLVELPAKPYEVKTAAGNWAPCTKGQAEFARALGANVQLRDQPAHGTESPEPGTPEWVHDVKHTVQMITRTRLFGEDPEPVSIYVRRWNRLLWLLDMPGYPLDSKLG